VNSKAVRITLNIAMLCQTIINPPKDGKEITRDDITCKMEYTANGKEGYLTRTEEKLKLPLNFT
jgi:collagen type IV alpha-3-binding protein